MKKIIYLLLCFMLIYFSPVFAGSDALSKIGKEGDKKWNEIIQSYKSKGNFVENKSAREITRNFKKYQGKITRFPKIDFSDMITDRKGNRYYYYGEKGSTDLFVVKYNMRINSKLQILSAAMGSLKGDWEIIGKIDDAYTWWGNVVHLDVVAIRIKGSVCATVKNNKVTLVGEEIMNAELAKKEKDAYSGIPKKLTSIPDGLDPLTVAKLFFYVGSVEKNKPVWSQLLAERSQGASSRSWWRIFNKYEREYFFVRENPKRANKPGAKCYMFQIKSKGKNMGTAKPCILVKEAGQWKIRSAYP
ncbi:MAG: hypothetical protein GY714_17435 [Desulfobacterales bacterium]|nr:hypothetical protein [Desulfobacterales bacterium]MCP4162853.1 hypothetical protein [Deltaproteobacteria bacterium]